VEPVCNINIATILRESKSFILFKFGAQLRRYFTLDVMKMNEDLLLQRTTENFSVFNAVNQLNLLAHLIILYPSEQLEHVTLYYPHVSVTGRISFRNKEVQ
jgi:hypothetical protein